MGSLKRLALLLILVAGLACGATRTELADAAPAGGDPQLCVENTGRYDATVVDGDGRRWFKVMTTDGRICRPWRGSSQVPQSICVDYLAGPGRTCTPVFFPGSVDCWLWRLVGSPPYDRNSCTYCDRAGPSMIPVDQTAFGYPDGNCLAACIASILELPLEEVPTFKETPGWFGKLRGWAFKRGWVVIYETHKEMRRQPPKGYHLMCGPAPRQIPCVAHRTPFGWDADCEECQAGDYIAHSTVALDGVLVHDPNPTRAGLRKVDDWLMLYPLDMEAKVVWKPNGPGA